jgi:outer membrane receptor protein involved in Fe transport
MSFCAWPASAQDSSPAPNPAPDQSSPGKAAGSDATDEIIITALPDENSSIDRTTYVVQDNAQARSSTVLDVLTRVPSVDLTPSGQLRLFGRSGVKVLIDGREVINPFGVLGNLQGSQIVRIEVISNPSAQFSAQGTAGIINVITRRAHGAGLGGSLTVSAGTLGNYNAKVSPTWSAGRLSLSGSLGLSRTGGRAEFRRDRYEIDSASRVTGLQSEVGASDFRGNDLTASLIATYQLSDREKLSSTAILRRGVTDRSERSTLEQSGSSEKIVDQTREGSSRLRALDYSLEYRREGNRKGESLTISAQHSSTKFLVDSTFLSVASGSSPGTFILVDDSSYDLSSAKADYIRPGKKGRLLTAGVSLERRSEISSSLARGMLPFREGLFEELSTLDASWTDKAVYLTYQFPLLGVTFLPGMRVEARRYDRSEAGAASGGTHLFPTLHMERRLGRSTRIGLSYSRRIAWPNPSALNPTVRFSDSTTAEVGNVLLRPEITDSYEAKFNTKAGKQSIDLTAYSRRTKNLFSKLPELNADGVLVSRNVNLGALTLRGANVSLRGPISRQLSYSVTGDLASESISDNFLGISLLRSRPQYSLATQVEYKDGQQDHKGADHVTLSYRYNGPFDRGLFTIAPYSSLNASWSHMITDRVAAVLNVGRILIPRATQVTTYSPSTVTREFYRSSGLKITASLTFTLRPSHRR